MLSDSPKPSDFLEQSVPRQAGPTHSRKPSKRDSKLDGDMLNGMTNGTPINDHEANHATFLTPSPSTGAMSTHAGSSIDITDFHTHETLAAEKNGSSIPAVPVLSPPVTIVISAEDQSSRLQTPAAYFTTGPTAVTRGGYFEESFAAAAENSRTSLPSSTENLSPHGPATGSAGRKARASLRKLLRPGRHGKSDASKRPDSPSPTTSSSSSSLLKPQLLDLPNVRRRSHVYSQRRSVSHAGAVALNTPLDVDHLSHDTVEPAPSFDLPSLPFAFSIDLSARNLSHFPALPSPRFEDLVELHLVNNWITAVPEAVIATLPNLQVLDLSQNLLTAIPSGIDCLKKLREVYVRENRLETVACELGRCVALEVVDFGRNLIKDFEPSTFATLTSLTTLDLSHNHLRILPASIGPLAPSLRVLYIHGNPFDTSFLTLCTPLMDAMAAEEPHTPDLVNAPSPTTLTDLQPTAPSETPDTPRTRRKRIQSMPAPPPTWSTSRIWAEDHGRKSGGSPTRKRPPLLGVFGGPKEILDVFTEPGELDSSANPEGIAVVNTPVSEDCEDKSNTASMATAVASEQQNPPSEQRRWSMNMAIGVETSEMPSATGRDSLSKRRFGMGSRRRSSRSENVSSPTLPTTPAPDSFTASYGPRTSSLPSMPPPPTTPHGSLRNRFSLFSLRTPTPTSHLPVATALAQLLHYLRDAHDLDPRTLNAEVDMLEPLAETSDREDGKEGNLKKQTSGRRRLVVEEIVNTERTYVRELGALVEVYVDPCEAKDLLSSYERNAIFANVRSILLFHKEHFLPDLEKQAEDSEQALGAVFLASAPFLRMYSTYYNNFDSATLLISQLDPALTTPATSNATKPAKNAHHLSKSFRDFALHAKTDPRHTQNSLQSFLILPVQRLPRYKLLVDELFECTPPSHSDYPALRRARDEVRRRVAECNEKKREWEARERGLHVLLRVKVRGWSAGVDAFRHVRPGRRFVREGSMRVLRCVEFVGAATGRVRLDALQACGGGKPGRFRIGIIGHLIETTFAKADVPSSVMSTATDPARVEHVTGREFRFFLFSDVLCWCRARPLGNTDGEHELIMGIALTPGCAELVEVDRGGDEGKEREGILRVRDRDSVVYLRGPWDEMEAWKSECSCNGEAEESS
ncbi:hypothetical protein HKX48_005031 [Thoreauomyces humboldtii]|nr:hypothetical protein HKX48_005031 [Thoreauomyces humboldtii]